ncbi:hypothetical protein ABEB36_015663 [Hypothenemus hampei]|uniref:Uncharacterized protein n=1 Tax=Hypothenemus hampei TaxID=57062 RepID=A0ABD1DZ47_HYPHA
MQAWFTFAAISLAVHFCEKKRNPRRWWVRPIYQRRLQQGDYHNLIKEMRLFDTEMFFHFTRMSIVQFENLLAIVAPKLRKGVSGNPSTQNIDCL